MPRRPPPPRSPEPPMTCCNVPILWQERDGASMAAYNAADSTPHLCKNTAPPPPLVSFSGRADEGSGRTPEGATHSPQGEGSQGQQPDQAEPNKLQGERADVKRGPERCCHVPPTSATAALNTKAASRRADEVGEVGAHGDDASNAPAFTTPQAASLSAASAPSAAALPAPIAAGGALSTPRRRRGTYIFGVLFGRRP